MTPRAPLWRVKALLSVLLLCYSIAASATSASPLELVQQTAERMLSALETNKDVIANDPTRIYALVDEIAVPHFDFERMSSWVLGKHWRTASPEQRALFTEQFRALLIRTYATAMAEYSGQKINYLPFKADPAATEVTVKTEIEQPGGPSIPINYSLFQNNGEWKVYDVIIDNTSLVANYRSSFASEIRNGGLDALIAKLAARTQQSGASSAGQ